MRIGQKYIINEAQNWYLQYIYIYIYSVIMI